MCLSVNTTVDMNVRVYKGAPRMCMCLHGYPLMRPNRRVDRIQLPSKMAMASSTEAPSQMMAWHAAVIRTASSVVF